jgi:hypothetical protein
MVYQAKSSIYACLRFLHGALARSTLVSTYCSLRQIRLRNLKLTTERKKRKKKKERKGAGGLSERGVVEEKT